MRAIIANTIVSIFLVAACADDADELTNGGGRRGVGGGENPGENPAEAPPTDPTQPGACTLGEPHVGFAQTDFVAERKVGGIGSDRRRVKPYSAIRTEFQRVIGTIPASLATSQAAFENVPARWYAEPTAGAVSLYTTYSIGFTGCYDTMTDPKYAAAPTTTSTTYECGAMQRRFWQRTPTVDETMACVDLIMNQTATETVARRRWAHGCASIISSAGFTTY